MTNATDRRTGRRGGRSGRPQIRTMPPGLLLAGGTGANAALTAIDLIAQARAARREAESRDGADRAEQG
ncbi:hypothetical protein MCBMB27_01076 [Methylobacterium phyllosphaerae]|jgi:hypothetical protein|uniref:Uncharacterized protein n=3 Tax=Methylobacterium TaxID=407 RepID=A0AAE8L5B7_9HYPH|nr:MULTISPECIES: hypothetical protein [Methylobacterium]APT30367.1 hypothetical protein MCBMB27_01076 [Methylobacterium phyllosphaerae]AWV18144.1 hypothetical protein A3862_23720 [Methylobacterium sp. XJLW]MBP28427.1 hypothetical protein [Methylobacterium sp.]SFU72752.1 hypothetical protein SAMN02799643_01999 [Methylobacterium sp. UNCCL125]RUP12987.1 MAG: hypothetical protein EKK43_19055 [Methylobacterium sp.]